MRYEAYIIENSHNKYLELFYGLSCSNDQVVVNYTSLYHTKYGVKRTKILFVNVKT